MYDKRPLLLSRMGNLLRNMHVESARQCYNQLLKNKYSHPVLNDFWQFVDHVDIYQTRQILLFLNALIEYKQEQYNEVLLRLRTLGEVLLGPNVADYLNEQDLASRKKFDKAVLRVDGLSNFLESNLNGIRPSYGWFADAKTLRTIYNYRYLNQPDNKPIELTHVSDSIEAIRELRNKLIHSAQPVSHQDLEDNFKMAGTSIDRLFEELHTFFEIAPGFGIFDTIRDEIRALL